MNQATELNIKNFGNLRKNKKGQFLSDYEDFMMKNIEIFARNNIRVYGFLGLVFLDLYEKIPHTFALELEDKKKLYGLSKKDQRKKYFRIGDKCIYHGYAIYNGILEISLIKSNVVKRGCYFQYWQVWIQLFENLLIKEKWKLK